MGRAPCCDKANVKKGPWLPEEDAALKSYIEEHGPVGNWITLPQKIGLRRCGKSCRLRWLNYLRPNIKHGGFSEEEDDIICSLYINIGSRWSIIAAQLPGRTDNDIKNYWNTKLKKKLLGKQRSKEHQVRIDGSKRERTNVSSGDENFSVISGSANAWPEVPQAVNSLPLATMSQSPNLITDQASLVASPVQLGPNSLPVLTNTYFPQYPNDMIPTPSHYPLEYTAFTSSQPPADSITHALMTQYNINMDKAPALLNNGLQEFSLGEIECHGLLDLLDVPNTGNIHGTHEMANGSVCSSAPSSGARSYATWEDISYLLAESTACPPLLCEYEAHSQSLGGGGGGLEDSPFEGSRL